MKFRFVMLSVAITGMLFLSGCTITHAVASDYPQYLANNAATDIGHTDMRAEYELTPETIANRYAFRSVTTGYANQWVVQFGQILGDTLQSAEVQRAFGQLVAGSGGNGDKLIFGLRNYEFAHFGASVNLEVTLVRDGKEVFRKDYQADGKTQGGKMFWAGAFGMKNAIQQSTKLALDDILRQLIADLNQQMRGTAAAGTVPTT